MHTATALATATPTSLAERLIQRGIIPLNRTLVESYIEMERLKLGATPGYAIFAPLLRWARKHWYELQGWSRTAIVAITVGTGYLLWEGWSRLWLIAVLPVIGVLVGLERVATFALDGKIPYKVKTPAYWEDGRITYARWLGSRDEKYSAPDAVQNLACKVFGDGRCDNILVLILMQDEITFDPVLAIREGEDIEYLAIWDKDTIIAISG